MTDTETQIEDDPLYSTRKVAATFHLTTETIRNWIKEGKIKAQIVNGRWYIRRSEMIRVANNRHGDI